MGLSENHVNAPLDTQWSIMVNHHFPKWLELEVSPISRHPNIPKYHIAGQISHSILFNPIRNFKSYFVPRYSHVCILQLMGQRNPAPQMFATSQQKKMIQKPSQLPTAAGFQNPQSSEMARFPKKYSMIFPQLNLSQDFPISINQSAIGVPP